MFITSLQHFSVPDATSASRRRQPIFVWRTIYSIATTCHSVTRTLATA